MATLTGQSIASSYEQLLHVDTDGGGNTTTLVPIKDGDNGTTFAAQLSTTTICIDNPTTSSSSQGGILRLQSDDGAALGDTHRLGVIEFGAAEDGSNTITTGARIEAIADAAWSASENGADMVFYTTDGNASQSEVLRLTADGKVGVGGDPGVNLHVINSGEAHLWVTSYVNAAEGSNLRLGLSRNATIGTHGAVAQHDILGQIVFFGSDADTNGGNESFEGAASIRGSVDEGVGNGDMPGRLTFHTSSDGSTDLAERLRIDRVGTVFCNTAGSNEKIRLEGTTDPYIRWCESATNKAYIQWSTSGYLYFANQEHNKYFTLTSSGLSIGDSANANMTQGLTINQAANDDEILAFKSSDVAHGVTDLAETDTFCFLKKAGVNDGGLQLYGLSGGTRAVEIIGLSTSDNTTKSTSGDGNIVLGARKKSSTSTTSVGSDGNLMVIRNVNTTRFIFDAEGSFHADVESTTFDAYDDAQLVRAYDLSHGKGMIESKFDQFIDYNHETLAELKLVGREEDGTPNRMVNVTGMQHLHNGAIWQQYTEMQKMKELMYDTMVEMIGKEKADKKLKDHDIKLLDNKTLLN